MYKYKMSYKDWHSPFYNINKYIDTYIINNYISSLHSGLAIKELCMARDGGKLENITLISSLYVSILLNTSILSISIWCIFFLNIIITHLCTHNIVVNSYCYFVFFMGFPSQVYLLYNYFSYDLKSPYELLISYFLTSLFH